MGPVAGVSTSCLSVATAHPDTPTTEDELLAGLVELFDQHDARGREFAASGPEDPLLSLLPVSRCPHLTAAEFSGKYRNKQPVVVPQLAHAWLAKTCWQDASYLASRLDALIPVLTSRDGHRFLKQDCDLSEQHFAAVVGRLFSEEVPRPRAYARAPLAGGLVEDVQLSELAAIFLGDAHASFKLDNCGVWLGSAGCVTPLHYDLCHGLLVQVRGVKRFTYFNPDQSRNLYPRPDRPELSRVLRVHGSNPRPLLLPYPHPNPIPSPTLLS